MDLLFSFPSDEPKMLTCALVKTHIPVGLQQWRAQRQRRFGPFLVSFRVPYEPIKKMRAQTAVRGECGGVHLWLGQ